MKNTLCDRILFVDIGWIDSIPILAHGFGFFYVLRNLMHPNQDPIINIIDQDINSIQSNIEQHYNCKSIRKDQLDENQNIIDHATNSGSIHCQDIGL